MARVRPFAAWRYSTPETDLTRLTAPPYDVISDALRSDLLTRDPHNVVALELPDGALDPETPGNRYENGRLLWDDWRESGVLAQDPEPTLYVLEQRFELEGRAVRRRAFIAEVGIEPFEAGVIIPHERTLPKALGDRFELIKSTGANLSQVFGLFDDPEGVSDAIFDEAMTTDPVAVATDDDGVESTLWAVPDAALGARLTSLMEAKQVFIADGHHRYTTALAHRDLHREQNGAQGTTDPAYDHVMMALVNMDDPDLAVLPYHRIASGPSAFDESGFLESLSSQFELSPIEPGHPSNALDGHARPAFLIKTRSHDRPWLAVLRADVDTATAIDLPRTSQWKSLDVSVLQELILWPLLGIHPDHPETLDRISFTKDPHEAFRATALRDVAFVLRPTSLTQLKQVSLSGETMPQKSTYFYPKLPSGLVMRSAV